jgi:hypothetical protein
MELLKKLKVSRRFALRGALGGIGVALWLPVLDAMCDENGTAFAAGEALPTTFGIWFWGNGIHVNRGWTPSGTPGSGSTWQLPVSLTDFAEVKDAMTYVTGLKMLDGVFKGHGWGMVYVLAGGDGNMCSITSDIDKDRTKQFETTQATQYLPTIDQVIADALAKQATDAGIKPPYFKSFETGVIPFSGDVNMGTVGDNIAHRAPNNYLSPKREPKDIFNKLMMATGSTTPPMGGGGSGGGGSGGSGTGVPSDISFRMRRSALDAVLEDCKRLKQTLGAVDVARIDSHMDGLREIEMRLPAVDGGGGTGNGTGGTGNGTGGGAVACKNPEAPPMTLADLTAKSQAINSLIVAMLSCNLTRVYTHMWSGPRSDSTYPVIQVNGAHHAITHNNDKDPNLEKIERYIMSQYADLAKRMKATPMGAGNLLDNTLLYGISDVAEPNAHIMKNWHIVLMGHAGGKLPGNRYVKFEEGAGRKVTELLLTMQQTMGMNVTSFGTWDKTSKTVSEIL